MVDTCFFELLEVCLDNAGIIFRRLILLLPFLIAFEFVEFGCCCSPIFVGGRLMVEVSDFVRERSGKKTISPPSSEGRAPAFGFLHLPIFSVYLDFLQDQDPPGHHQSSQQGLEQRVQMVSEGRHRFETCEAAVVASLLSTRGLGEGNLCQDGWHRI